MKSQRKLSKMAKQIQDGCCPCNPVVFPNVLSDYNSSYAPLTKSPICLFTSIKNTSSSISNVMVQSYIENDKKTKKIDKLTK
ncbi:hypothetical protein SNEBB_006011 [Seison nebaliae]|nr:hypothetical protein SNEBB_006011 [Seison nebaliae]